MSVTSRHWWSRFARIDKSIIDANKECSLEPFSIRPHWTGDFDDLHESFEELINSFRVLVGFAERKKIYVLQVKLKWRRVNVKNL